MKKFELWSRGLEAWELVHLSEDDAQTLRRLYTKTVQEVTYVIYVDDTGRYFRSMCTENV